MPQSDDITAFYQVPCQVLSFLPDEQCGTALFGACDADMDGSIREDEWSMCLGCKGTDLLNWHILFDHKHKHKQ